jgi:hypothetical protein
MWHCLAVIQGRTPAYPFGALIPNTPKFSGHKTSNFQCFTWYIWFKKHEIEGWTDFIHSNLALCHWEVVQNCQIFRLKAIFRWFGTILFGLRGPKFSDPHQTFLAWTPTIQWSQYQSSIGISQGSSRGGSTTLSDANVPNHYIAIKILTHKWDAFCSVNTADKKKLLTLYPIFFYMLNMFLVVEILKCAF